MPQDLECNSPATSWLSQGFEELVWKLEASRGTAHGEGQNAPTVDYEVVVVGSGYGGSVAAAHWAARRSRGEVCVLERGREYLQGMFPSRFAEVPGQVRFSSGGPGPRGVRTGLFDLRLGRDVSAVVANGLGGGSLINAGVMEQPSPDVMNNQNWPASLRRGLDRKWFSQASELLGAAQNGAANQWNGPGLHKLRVMEELAQRPLLEPALAIAMEDKLSAGGVALKQCIACGDCASGCNYGAKESLDTNLLVRARLAGAEIYCGATVSRLEKRDDGAWIVYAEYTDDKLRRRQVSALPIVARMVILAAGTFGSTEILLRSQSASLQFSKCLGTRFSANGDSLAMLVDLERNADAVADENQAPAQRGVGPTITSMIDARAALPQIVVQDLTVPGPLRWFFEQSVAVAAGFADLSRGDTSAHATENVDPCAIDPNRLRRSLVVAAIGHDNANGVMELHPQPAESDGAVRVRWPEARNDDRLDQRQRWIEELHCSSHVGGRVLANPFWRLWPRELSFLFQDERGPVVTVHPLGGCPMGDDVRRGVVDDRGRVYAPSAIGQAHQFHDGLFVLDGSIIPSSLGINPALTITALALRALNYVPPVAPAIRIERPVFRALAPNATPPSASQPATEVQVVERMHGKVFIHGQVEPAFAQITLQFKPAALRDLMSPRAALRELVLDPEQSYVRLFDRHAACEARKFADDELPDADAFWVAPLTAGTLGLLQREPSSASQRRARSLRAWLFNRGLRDSWQELADRRAGRQPQTEREKTLGSLVWERAGAVRRLAQLAGEVRLFEYDLVLGAPTINSRNLQIASGQQLEIRKRLAYERRANPWNQLMRATLSGGPFRDARGGPAKLAVDLRFFEHRGVPLFRLVNQSDQVTSLVDVASFLLYVSRIMLRIHNWSFRKPDARNLNDPPPNRDPSAPACMSIREVKRLALRRSDPAEPDAYARLTRFTSRGRGDAAPVLMIHGYSVSGTTFAHHTAPSLARHLWKEDWDPWVLDLRTSAALPTASYPWSFEQVAYADIPVAVDYILRATGREKLFIVAHCMGSAMTCMALLGDLAGEHSPDLPASQYIPPDPYPELRKKLRSSIGALVLSQVTPYTLFTPNNLLRAFILRYLIQYLDHDNYTFRVEGEPGLGDQLLDRILSTHPYPEDEFERENPPIHRFWKRTPWTSTRHRMDALYGRDFSLRNIDDEVLRYIDDLFGPLSIHTVSQAIQFARRRVLTDRMGINEYVTLDRLKARLNIPILSIHSEDNGLVDVSTRYYMQELYSATFDGEHRHRALFIPGHGHQDTFIGRRAEKLVFPKIAEFLDEQRRGA